MIFDVKHIAQSVHTSGQSSLPFLTGLGPSISRAVEHVRARSARDKYKNKHLGQLSTRQSDYSRAADVSFIMTAENTRMRHTERERKQRDVTWEERDSISHRKEQTDESRKLMRIDRNASQPVNWGGGDVSHFKSLSLHGQNWQVQENWCFVRFSSFLRIPAELVEGVHLFWHDHRALCVVFSD